MNIIDISTGLQAPPRQFSAHYTYATWQWSVRHLCVVQLHVLAFGELCLPATGSQAHRPLQLKAMNHATV